MAKEKTTKLQRQEKKAGFAIGATTIMTIYSISLLLPLAWAVLFSLMDPSEFAWLDSPFPSTFVFQNYIDAFTQIELRITAVGPNYGRDIQLLEMFGYSLYTSVVFALVAEFTRAACAYCAAKFRNHREMIFMHKLVVVLMVISLPSTLASAIVMRQNYGIYDNILGETLLNIGFTGIHFLYYYAAFKGVSSGYMEAARIDGANEYTIFFRIMLPLIKGTFLALFLLDFIGMWNNYKLSLEYLPSYPVVAYGLFRMRTMRVASNIPVQLAGCSLVIFPTLVLFIIFKEKLIGSLSIGGLKG